MSTADKTMARHPFVAQFIDQGRARSTDDLPQWWADFRTSSLKRLVSLDVPGRKDEDWRFINLSPITGKDYITTDEAVLETDESALGDSLLPESKSAQVVFLNGRYEPKLSNLSGLSEDVLVTTWSELAKQDDPKSLEDYIDIVDFWKDDVFYNLNSANFEDGAVVLVPRNEIVETPIHLLYVSSGDKGNYAAHPRNVIVAGESAEVTVVEEYATIGEGTYFHNVVSEVSLGANSNVRHVKVQQESRDAYHMARNIVTLAQDSNYKGTAVNLGAALSRNDSYARFEGKNVECTLDGLVYMTGRQVTDTHTVLDHALPDSLSYQLHKAIVDDQAHSVFNGKIWVRKDAQRIDSNQLNQNLVLSPRAHVDTKPQLEIFADDVVCSHGATVGQLENDQLFYLMSRGIEAEKARALLTYAFAAEVLETIQVDSLRNRLEALLLDAMEANPE